ncbi:MAG: 2-amino-4-hydroxy-6-hydroxymethyldihydropteridine diphosphokinase [Pelagibacteraceae bacterium TMED287]|nr:MAG: 2-amino-4-hydroxy-6-hydroxymethyldihydropteridine diphosphokinase [Pelagibacteraceae bacterium TMED287]|tara:strand:+ start:3681 stop:4190 length:510 start_codon:yes stop_codon:yes gene_type:complete
MILLGIGSNLESKFGNRLSNIKKTIDFLKEEKIKIIQISDFYETPSYPDSELPKFINVVVQINFNQNPKELMSLILKVEKKMGRIRNYLNEPRTCDIDIIDFDGKVMNSKNVTLPHPKSHERNFVLYPLYEICPNWIHPVNKEKIEILIKKLSLKTTNEITRMKESDIL